VERVHHLLFQHPAWSHPFNPAPMLLTIQRIMRGVNWHNWALALAHHRLQLTLCLRLPAHSHQPH
jgi:hypothetical protein